MVIISSQRHDHTTSEVIGWLRAMGREVLRINSDQPDWPSGPLSIRLEGTEVDFSLGDADKDAPDAYWYRRGGKAGGNLRLDPADWPEETKAKLRRHRQREGQIVEAWIDDRLQRQELRVLGGYHHRVVHKGIALQRAARAGWDIPSTLVTNQREAVRDFARKHGKLIVKCLSDATVLFRADEAYTLYTEILDEAHIAQLPAYFFPSLVQACQSKAYEIRTFYLDGACYSMAIFSQGSGQTSLDFRRYNHQHPNRTVPYRLPAPQEAAARAFMQAMGLNTGSIDIIRTTDDRFVFLEVNPVGQFGMVSRPCNYYLEKKVAAFLAGEPH